MEDRKVSTTVKINDKSYLINKTTPRTACWLFCFMASRANGKSIMQGLGACTQQEFNEIQDIALRLVFKNLDGFPVAVIAPDGSFVFKDLEAEPEHVFRLTCASIGFQLEPFLPADDSNSPRTVAPDGK